MTKQDLSDKFKKKTVSVQESFKDGHLTLQTETDQILSFRRLSGSVFIDGHSRLLYNAGLHADKGRSGEISFRFEDGILWRWHIRKQAGKLYITAALSNESDRDISVGNWNILHGISEAGGLVDLGLVPEQVRFFSWRPWNMRVERFSEAESERESNTICHLYDPHSSRTILLGFVTLERMASVHKLQYIRERGITEYRAQCAFGEHVLKPGVELQSETLRISYHVNPHEALESWADEVHTRYKPSFENTAGVCIGGGGLGKWPETLQARAAAAGETLKGFDLSLLTGGTHSILKNGLPGNWLVFEAFNGQKDVCEKLLKSMHAKGFTFKFWFSPFWFFAEAEGILEENKGNLLKDAQGEPITQRFEGGGWEFGRGQYSETPLTKVYLDGTHPDTKSYLRRIFKAYRELGVRAYMLDFLAIKPEAKLHDDSLLPIQAGREILKVIREAAGADTHLQTAVASSPGFIGCIQAARVVRDYGEGRPLHPTPNWRNAEFCLHDRHFSDAHSFVQNAAASWFTNRKIYINDLNQLKIDKPIPLEHARISVTMFGLSGDSPMVIGDNLQEIAPERLRMLKMCLPRTTGIPEPVDLFENVAPEDYSHILKKAITTDGDTYMLAAVFNTSPDNHVPGKQHYRAKIEFSGLGLDPAQKYRIFEFWNEEYIGTYKDAFFCTIPPDACRLFRISLARPHPWLLGTDMHIEQGNAEIESLAWDEENLVLRGTARRPSGESGNLFFLMPRHLKLVNDKRTNKMKEVIDMQTIIRMPLDFQKTRQEFELQFQRMDTPYVSRKGWLPYATETEWLNFVAEHKIPDSHRVIE